MSQMRAHLLTAGLSPSDAGRVEKQILIWIKSSGPEWTVSRLKAIKMWYIHKLNGDQFVPDLWISIHGGRIRGPLGCIFKLKKPRKVLDALMVYTGIILSKPSQRQIKKFFSSVEAPPVRIGLVPFLCSTVEDFMSSSDLEYSNGMDSWKRYAYTGRKFLPNVDCSRSIPNRITALCDDFRSESIHNALQNDALESEISHALGMLYPGLLELTDLDPVPNSAFIGKIGCIQERGCKGRFIANPRLTYQLCLKNLALYLQRVQMSLPSDCTFHQEEGVNWAQRKLKTGHDLFSIDLSDASNHVPYRLTRHILRWLEVPMRVIETMDWVSTGMYRWNRGTGGALAGSLSTRWTKGQPLGTYPSFPAFSLTLGFVLKSIERALGTGDAFRSLGDDIIISDERVAKRFTDFLDTYQMPVSIDKSISGKIGEFASYLISKKFKFRPSKIVQPNENNLLYRLGRKIEVAGDAKTPLELLAHGERILSQSNAGGISLHERASIAMALGLIDMERSEPFTRKERTGLYSALKYAIMDTLKYYGGAESQSPTHVVDIQEYLGAIEQVIASGPCYFRPDEPLLLCILRELNVRDEEFSQAEIQAFANSIPWYFSRSYEGVPISLAKKLSRAVKAQTSILRQSYATVRKRLLDSILYIMEHPDDPYGIQPEWKRSPKSDTHSED